MNIASDISFWLTPADDAPPRPEVITYTHGECSFITGLLPSLAVQLPGSTVLEWLRARLGVKVLQNCLTVDYRHPSPLQGHPDTAWMKTANLVGINVRTIGNFWNVIKYSFTLPAGQSAIHLLPMWEPGVVASLYGMSSRNINPEFFSAELAALCPQLHTVELQLKAVVNLLHALGRSVGMDVIPHTDRYAEIVLANPQHFEWLQRFDLEIVDHSAGLHEKVQACILEFLEVVGPGQTGLAWPPRYQDFFAEEYGESRRLLVLFGVREDVAGRGRRRGELVNWLFQNGYEPVPATMGPPYRGLEADPRPEAASRDHLGRVWREYRLQKPQAMSRVFGPLTRYKLYDRLDDNARWAIDFDRPRPATWQYVVDFYAGIQQEYHLDFMRGDMSHVQMRPSGVPLKPGACYDLHQAVGRHIRKQTPYFAYFAETFLAAPDFMAYGDELDHLELVEADATLGDLQSMTVGAPDFMQHFRWYLDLLATRRFAPSFTIMTGDKDDPRFDKFYVRGNEARLFMGLFLTNMPSYMGLGFEQRDTHLKPAANEYYTKLYVFSIDQGDKATRGPYRWGHNLTLFHRLQRIRLQADQLWTEIAGRHVQWLIYPNPAGTHFVIAWQLVGCPYLFVVNLETRKGLRNIKIPQPTPKAKYRPLFSTHREGVPKQRPVASNGLQLQIGNLLAGEGRIYLRD